MKCLLLVGLICGINVSYAVVGSSAGKTIKEANNLIKEIKSFSQRIIKKYERQGISTKDTNNDLKQIKSYQTKLVEALESKSISQNDIGDAFLWLAEAKAAIAHIVPIEAGKVFLER